MFSSLTTVATQVAVLFILIGIGFLCSKKKIFDEHTIKHLTHFILYFVTPTVVINSFNREYDPLLAKKLIISAGCAALAHGLFIALSYILIHDKVQAKRAVLRYGVIFSNCGYMALPLQNAILGNEGVFLGTAYIGIFNLLTWTFGLVLMSGSFKEISIKKIFINPGIIGIAAGLIIFLTPLKLPVILASPILHLANLNTPLPMFVIGYYLAQITTFAVLKDIKLLTGIFMRLVICPLVILGAMLLLGIRDNILPAMVIAASAPTAANTTMFSAKYEKDTQASVTMVAMSTLFSILTMPVLVTLAVSLMR